jgi:hypothetical protein
MAQGLKDIVRQGDALGGGPGLLKIDQGLDDRGDSVFFFESESFFAADGSDGFSVNAGRARESSGRRVRASLRIRIKFWLARSINICSFDVVSIRLFPTSIEFQGQRAAPFKARHRHCSWLKT